MQTKAAKTLLMTVSVVDDEQAVLQSLAACVATVPGFAVIGTYQSGKEALAEIPLHPPDILQLDLVMPGTSGLACARKLDTLGLRPRLIFMTGFPDTDVIEAAMHFRGVSFLVKPFKFEHLKEALQVVATGGLYLSPLAKTFLAQNGSPQQTELRLRDLSRLTRTELEVLSDYRRGLRCKEIADKRGVAPCTVENQMSGIRAKLGVHRMREAIWKVFRRFQ